jgi:hypothetical protein
MASAAAAAATAAAAAATLASARTSSPAFFRIVLVVKDAERLARTAYWVDCSIAVQKAGIGCGGRQRRLAGRSDERRCQESLEAVQSRP